MIKLYGGERSRAVIVRWYLEELAIPYDAPTIPLT